jgi:hypothetical protein
LVAFNRESALVTEGRIELIVSRHLSPRAKS